LEQFQLAAGGHEPLAGGRELLVDKVSADSLLDDLRVRDSASDEDDEDILQGLVRPRRDSDAVDEVFTQL